MVAKPNETGKTKTVPNHNNWFGSGFIFKLEYDVLIHRFAFIPLPCFEFVVLGIFDVLTLQSIL